MGESSGRVSREQELEAIIAQQAARIAQLEKRIAELETALAKALKNSSTSSNSRPSRPTS